MRFCEFSCTFLYILAAIDVFAVPPRVAPCQDWPQWGGNSHRNHVAHSSHIPDEWSIGKSFPNERQIEPADTENLKWIAELGTVTYGGPVVAEGCVFVGTNNGNGYLKRYPPNVDLGCLICFREEDGEFRNRSRAEKVSGAW